MPDLQDFRWYRDGSVNVSAFPRYRVEGKYMDTDPVTGLYVPTHDFTGANRLTFPTDVRNYTEAQRSYLLDVLARAMMELAANKADLSSYE